MNLDTSAASYYTTLEVAKMLGMAVRSVQLMVDRGDLQAWKTPGGHRRITRDSLERWMQGSRSSGMRAPTAPRPADGGDQRGVSRRRGAQAPRVLLIEDSSHFQNLVSLMVKQKFPDVELHIASDGITGLVSFGQLQPDLIIVDILLPGIDGASLITGLRRHALFGHCQLIVLTSLDEAQRGPYAFALDDVTVIHKPRLMTELPHRMAEVLQVSQVAAPPVSPAATADAPAGE
jgi:excisionase family DNA binding protein